MSLKEIEDMSLAQFLLYSVEAHEIGKQQNEGSGGKGGQSFRSHM